MKKCEFCDHCGCTIKDEKVCKKHLVYVGDDVYFPCNSFTIKLEAKHATVMLGICIVVLSLIFAL